MYHCKSSLWSYNSSKGGEIMQSPWPFDKSVPELQFAKLVRLHKDLCKELLIYRLKQLLFGFEKGLFKSWGL